MKSTFLKVMAIICLVLGIFAAAFAAMSIAGIGMLSSAVESGLDIADVEVAAEAATVATVAAGVLIVALVIAVVDGIIMILAGVLGIKASNDVTKIKGAIIMGIIMVVFGVISIITSAVGGALSWSNFTGLIIPVLYCLAAFMFKKKAQ